MEGSRFAAGNREEIMERQYIKPGFYSDGSPLDRVHYLECKIILKPDGFTSANALREYRTTVREAANQTGITYSAAGMERLQPAVREIRFLDTPDFRLYNNGFILRQRVRYVDGFPLGAPEIVFKFRHPDLQTAAEHDVRPKFDIRHKIKFKAEALPLRDRVGGGRMLYSHNVQFGLNEAPEGDRKSLTNLGRAFPCLEALRQSEADRVELVNQAIVEEVLLDLAVLGFGKGVSAKCNVALWRMRGDHAPLIGEFAFQARFNRADALHDKAIERARQFFKLLQIIDEERVLLGTTKTGAVYRLSGNPLQCHE
ncbi:MAG TPA: hypothetical protein VMA37_06995 [Acetobacteraceae bacterium]|nr:hypothetical protein [Acetobacteraceae bacterium]